MVEGANILKNYDKADLAGKVDIICKHYANFMGIIDGFTERIRYMMENEMAYKRNKEKGELGIRIQCGDGHSDFTATSAINGVITTEAIIQCDFSGYSLEDIENLTEYFQNALILRQMREDFALFNKQMFILGKEETRIFKSYLNREMDIMGLADAEGVAYRSIIQRVRRAKIKIKIQMEDFMGRAA